MRNGANMDANRAQLYKANFLSKINKYTSIKRQFMPEGYGKLTPGGSFEARMTMPGYGGYNMAIIAPSSLSFKDETPTGTIDSSNDTFTLSETPVSGSLKLFQDGVLLKATTHYTLSGATITFETAFIPWTGQRLFANYRY